MASPLKSLFTLLFALSLLPDVLAQTGTRISGTIVNDQLQAMPAATITLFNARDTTKIRQTTADQKGRFLFSQVDSGIYFIGTTAVGREPFSGRTFHLGANEQKDIDTIRLSVHTDTLAGVVVQGSRPPIENKLDKVILNVSASPVNAGTTALDVLAKAPGVTVDNQGNVSLKGKPGVQLYIDGKPSYLSPQDLAILLKGMPAAQLSQIEIMSQPSSLYDAAGNAGIINLKMAKNKETGFTGTLNSAYSQGKYGRFPNSLLFNYTKGKWLFYTSFSYSRWTDFNDVALIRKFPLGADTAITFRQNSSILFKGENFNFRAGADYHLNETTTIGISVSGVFNHNKSTVNSTTGMFSTTPFPDSISLTTGFRDDRSRNRSVNLNLEKKLDSLGKKITADADYITYNNPGHQYAANTVNHIDGSPSSPPLYLRAWLPSGISIYSFKAAYTHPLKEGAKLEAGIKASAVKIDNKAPYEILDNASGNWVTDTSRADYFRYSENIYALYLNVNKEWKKWSLQAGLRYEQTHSTGLQVWTGQAYPRKYGQLFPTFYAGYKLSAASQLLFSYGRRLDRPNYQDMNPFQRFLDKFTYIKGNPLLQPQFSNNLELTYVFKNKLTTTFYYTFINHIINDVLVQNNATKITYRTKGNIGTSSVKGLSSNYSAKINAGWYLNLFANVYKNQFNGVLDNIPVNSSAWNFSSSFSTQLKFAGTWTAEVSGTYQGRMLENAIYTMAPRGVVSFALAKQLLKNNATITLNLTDPFNLQQSHAISQYGDVYLDVHSHWDNRRIGLSLMYRFKKGKAGANRKTPNVLDEQKRVN